MKRLLIPLAFFFLFVILINQSLAANQIKVTGFVLHWENGSVVSNSNITAQLWYEDQLLDEDKNTTDSNGDYVIYLSGNLEQGNKYKLIINATKNQSTSYVEKVFEI